MEDKSSEFYGFVYMTTNLVSGLKYIGSCRFHRKQCSWKTYLGSSVKLKQDIARLGKENFKRDILEYAKYEEELRILEEKYIETYNAVVNDEFYNLKYSSMGGDTFTCKSEAEKEITRQRMSAATSGKNNPMYGREKTEKFKQSIVKSNGNMCSVRGVIYPSISAAIRALNITRRSDQGRFRDKFKDENDLDHVILRPRKADTAK